MRRDFSVATPRGILTGHLTLPPVPRGLILVAHLLEIPDAVVLDPALGQFAILSVALMTEREISNPDLPYNVPLLTERFLHILELVQRDGDTEALPLGLYAVGHAVPAAIRAAAQRDNQIHCLACRGGLVDQAGLQYLHLLAAPLLLLADEGDGTTETSYRRAAPHLSVSHQFHSLQPVENPAHRLGQWFGEHLQAI